MQRLPHLRVLLGSLLALLVLGCLLLAPQIAADPAPEEDTALSGDQLERAQMVERGRYLVHQASMCVQCHSPRDRQGELKTDRLLTGGSVPVTNPYEGARWAFHAPNLIRAPGYTEAEFLRLLQTGIRPDGTRPRSPMPPYRMSEGDARAIYLYLNSI
jgi:hypothetical protein